MERMVVLVTVALVVVAMLMAMAAPALAQAFHSSAGLCEAQEHTDKAKEPLICFDPI